MNASGEIFCVPDTIILNNKEEWVKIVDYKVFKSQNPKYTDLTPECLIDLQNSYQIYKENTCYEKKYQEIVINRYNFKERIVQARKEDFNKKEIEDMIENSTPNPILHEIEMAEKRKRDEEVILFSI